MPAPVSNRPPQKFLGLFAKKERWGLSWRGWLVLSAILLVSGYVLMVEIQPFLAVTARVDSNNLVMEGWVHQFAAQAAAAEFRMGAYREIYVTGVPVEGSGEYGSDSDTEAFVGAGLLRRAGIPEEFLQKIPRRKVDRDRTYGSALALKEWFSEHNLTVHSINIVTEDTHARRTRLLFQEALGPDVKVGIIAVPDPDYDPKRWWHYSEGVRNVINEAIAYLYAKFLFWPGTVENTGNPPVAFRYGYELARTVDLTKCDKLSAS
jgi:uncharacterized SAM-binding protein YcdF (DUF218 family)